MEKNPLIDDRLIPLFLAYARVEEILGFDAYEDHDLAMMDDTIRAMLTFSRDEMFPRYPAIDRDPPRFVDGKIFVHEETKVLYARLCELGVIAAMRPIADGGTGLPMTVTTLVYASLMAGNLSAFSFAGLTSGASHLIESFGNDELKAMYVEKMHSGEWSGTMALTEPQAGSGLSDITTKATANNDGSFQIRGSKIFISAGDHDLTENIVHLVLARIDGAPPGTKGISLFAVPKKRVESGNLVFNDVTVSGNLHKIGWRGVPSLALEFGTDDNCRGHLVGAPNRGLAAMFQMMNEARLMVGIHAVSTASVAYHESRLYALERRQGRHPSNRDPTSPPLPIIAHDDVRRMLLAQKSMVDGGYGLALLAARHHDWSHAHPDDSVRKRSAQILDVLTPVVKTWSAEKGFESCALAVQVLGGYGYTSEFLPEAFMRDQKLNTLHEGTTGIQALDLLGRKVLQQNGEGLRAFLDDMAVDCVAARECGFDDALVASVENALQSLGAVTLHLAQKGLSGDVDGMLRHAKAYLDLFAVVAVSAVHLGLARIAKDTASHDVNEGVERSARYFIANELPHATALLAVLMSDDDSFSTMQNDWF